MYESCLENKTDIERQGHSGVIVIFTQVIYDRSVKHVVMSK